MSGLDKMKAQIIAEAQDNAKEILAQAHAQADSIIGEAKAQAEKDARKIVAQAEARAEDSVKRLASSSDMRKRKAVLEAKQEVISEVLEDAYKAVGELDDAAYFARRKPGTYRDSAGWNGWGIYPDLWRHRRKLYDQSVV